MGRTGVMEEQQAVRADAGTCASNCMPAGSDAVITCPAHKIPMVLRPPHPEQSWCGTWFDCPRCTYSVLLPSVEVWVSTKRGEPAEAAA